MKKDIENPKLHMSVPEDYFKNLNKQIKLKIEKNVSEMHKSKSKITFSTWMQVAAAIGVVCFFSWILTDAPSENQFNENSYVKIHMNDSNKFYDATVNDEEYLLFLNDLITDQETEIWFADN